MPSGQYEPWETGSSDKKETTVPTESAARVWTRRGFFAAGITGILGVLGIQQVRIGQLEERVRMMDRIRQSLPPDLVDLAERTLPSLSRIERVHAPQLLFPQPPAPNPPDNTSKKSQFRPPHREDAGIGSGFFVRREQGHTLVTAGHIIWLPLENQAEGACRVYPSWHRDGFASAPVTMDGGRTAYLPHHEGDLTALRIPPEEHIPDNIGLTIRNMEREPLRRGERVVAMGSPLAMDSTVTDGIISNPDADVPLENGLAGFTRCPLHLVQFSAPIEEGSSGGAIVDMQGRVVGLTIVVLGAGSGFGIGVRADSIAQVLRGWGINVLER